MIWKELKTGSYKNYGYHIYGKYTEDYPTLFDGEVIYKESIETKVKIMNPLGEIVHENNWFHMMMHGHEDYHSQYLISFRNVLKTVWYKMSPNLVETIHIKDDYDRVVRDWVKYAEQVIDGEIKGFEKERYEQEMTDGLPDSVLIKYLDR